MLTSSLSVRTGPTPGQEPQVGSSGQVRCARRAPLGLQQSSCCKSTRQESGSLHALPIHSGCNCWRHSQEVTPDLSYELQNEGSEWVKRSPFPEVSRSEIFFFYCSREWLLYISSNCICIFNCTNSVCFNFMLLLLLIILNLIIAASCIFILNR